MKNSEHNGQPNRIERSTKITGEIVSEADFRIDGTLEGSITTSGKVVIGKEEQLTEWLIALNADVEGKFNGNIEVKESLSLKITSIIEGRSCHRKAHCRIGCSIQCKMFYENSS